MNQLRILKSQIVQLVVLIIENWKILKGILVQLKIPKFQLNQQSGILSFEASIGDIKNSTFSDNKDGGIYSFRNSYNNPNVYTLGNIEDSTFSLLLV